MGCVNSKQNRCNHCNTPYCSVSRTYPMHVHHPPQNKGDSYHLVALTSTTLGSLELLSQNNQGNGFISTSSTSFEEENEAKTWSNMIEKLPKAISMSSMTTMSCEHENETIINTWELMEGLEEFSPFQSPNQLKSFSFDVVSEKSSNEITGLSCGLGRSLYVNVNGHVDPLKPSFMENDDDIDLHKPKFDQMIVDGLNDSSLDFDDCKVVSSFKKSYQEEGLDKNIFFFEENKINDDVFVDNKEFKLDSYRKKEKVVLYFTSLRMVRKTYEDCCKVKIILKGLGIRVDERDVSMHLGFKEELKELLGEECYGKLGGLPKVFIRRKFIGGIEEIQKLHDDKKLEKLFDNCERISDNIEGCDVCGDIKFVPCETCYGSCKIYYEGDYDQEEDCEVGECGFQRCPNCNENGLIRCSMCCF